MHIKEIAVRNLGPIGEFKCEPALVNCIYGPNEAGKTLMVEFIISSLFKDANLWEDLRDLPYSAMGRVRVEVIQEGKKIVREFLPEISKGKKQKGVKDKIEKFLPISNIHRLLIVKSGDVNIDSKHPLTKECLVNFLSQNNIYTQISAKISQTVKSAQIKDGIINIPKWGEGKLYHNLKNEIIHLEKLIEELISQYNPTQIKELEREIERLEEEKRLQIKAKKYRAYKLFTQIEKLKREIKELPSQEEINFIKERIEEFNSLSLKLKDKQNELNELEKKIKELEVLCEEFKEQTKARGYKAYQLSEKIRNLKIELETKYPQELLNNIEKNIETWREKAQELEHKKKKGKELEKDLSILNELESIRDIYAKFIENPPLKPPSLFVLVISFLFVFSGSLLSLTGLTWAILGIFLGLVGILYFLLKYHKSTKDILKVEEIEALKNRFRELTGQELASLSILSFKIETLKEKRSAFENLGIDRLKTECEILYHKIKEDFKVLGHTLPDETEIDFSHFSEIYEKLLEILNKFKQEKKEKEEELKHLEKLLAKLDIEETEYVREKPEIEFDKNRYEELKASLEELKRLKNREEELKTEIGKLNLILDNLEKNIKEWFKDHLKVELKTEEWKKKIKELENEINAKIKEVNRLEGEFNGLGVEEEDLLSEDPGVTYQKGLLEKIEDKIKELIKRKSEAEENLKSLKAKVSYITGKDITTPWPELIKCLYEKREEKKNELREITARIVAGYLVHNVIEKEKKDIERWLEEVLNSEEIKNIIEKITTKYKEFRIGEKEILISDGYANFSLKDLSTGAKEQVLIGLRIGMAQKFFNSMSGFLILDDAFQHVDWKKREKLVDTLINFAEKTNWQIFYFTMDDHIKSLFENYLNKKPETVKIWNLEDTSSYYKLTKEKTSVEKKEPKISGSIYSLFSLEKEKIN